MFNRNICGFKAGDTGKLQGITDKHLLVESDNRIRPVPFKDLERITVCQPKELSLSVGDRLQLKANDKSQDGRKLANGELVAVKEIHADGRIALDDGRVLPKHYRQFVRGYAVTSYAAQGKNCGLRSVFGFGGKSGDKSKPVVCHDFTRAQGRENFHGG